MLGRLLLIKIHQIASITIKITISNKKKADIIRLSTLSLNKPLIREIINIIKEYL